jgi:hypothetical protein
MTLGNSARPAPWTIIGYRKDGRPIHLLAGGSGEDEDDTGLDLGADDGEEDAEEEPDEVEADETEAEEEKPKPKPKPQPKPAAKGPTEADLTRVTGALEKERAAAKTARATVRELQAELRAAKKAAEPKTGDDDAVVKAVEEARAEEAAKFKPIVVTKAARAALLEAGLATDTPSDKVKKMLRLIDFDDIDFDEDGEVSGLEDQIDQIKTDFPELFRKPEPEKPEPKPRAPKIDAADRKNVQPQPKTTGEKHAAAILGNM